LSYYFLHPLTISFYIQHLNLSNNIPVITQEEFETKLLPQPKLAMALPLLASSLSVTSVQHPPKKLLQMTLVSSKFRATNAKLLVPNPIPKNRFKTIKSKKKTGPKMSANPNKVPNDCKDSVQLAHYLHVQELKNLFNSY
jgi:hypothetical protein